MLLRLRTKNGVETLTVSPHYTVRQLHEEIERKTGIEVSKQKSESYPLLTYLLLTRCSFVWIPAKGTSS